MGRPKSGESFDYERLRIMINEGCTIAQIAEAMGVTTRTINRQKRSIGLSNPRPTSRPLEEWAHKAAQLLTEGYSLRSVSELTGIGRTTLSRHFPGQGWTKHQVGHYAAEVRRLNQLPRFLQPERRNHHSQECK